MRIDVGLALALLVMPAAWLGCQTKSSSEAPVPDLPVMDQDEARAMAIQVAQEYIGLYRDRKNQSSSDTDSRITLSQWDLDELAEDVFEEELDAYTLEEQQQLKTALSTGLGSLMTSTDVADRLASIEDPTFESDRQDDDTMWVSVQGRTSNDESLDLMFLVRRVEDDWFIVDFGRSDIMLGDELRRARKDLGGTLLGFAEVIGEDLQLLSERWLQPDPSPID